MRKLAPRGLVLPFLLVFGVGCGSSLADDPILQLSAQEALEEGKTLMARKKYRQARPYLIHAFEVEPNSVSGREGLLLAADALFFSGSQTDFVEAERRYRDFLNRFPTSDQAAYAQFRIASCLARRMAKPDREQAIALKALAEFQNLIRLYPTSPYAAEARSEMVAVDDRLAEHDFKVGAFYLRFGLPRSAADRFRQVLEDYPGYARRDKILFFLCKAYQESEQPENAAEACARLRQEHPESNYVNKLPATEEKKSDAEASADDLATNGRV